MLDFLQVPYAENDVKLKLTEGFELFHRKSNNPSFDHYTQSQKISIQNVVNRTINLCKANNKPTLGLETYLLRNISQSI